jgi:hypothetical protein
MQEKRTAGLVADHFRKLGLEVFIDRVRTGCLSRDSVLNIGTGTSAAGSREYVEAAPG